jgi:hypothetical protein
MPVEIVFETDALMEDKERGIAPVGCPVASVHVAEPMR